MSGISTAASILALAFLTASGAAPVPSKAPPPSGAAAAVATTAPSKAPPPAGDAAAVATTAVRSDTAARTATVAARPAVVTHGGAGSPRSRLDGTEAAAKKGLELLRKGGGALEAALAAAVVLEDDCRFNAGTGSNIRLDGKTVQMDAAVMDGATGRYGAVAQIERTKNPVLVARKVMETPHLLIVGEGATAFARAMGFGDYDPVCPVSRARYEKVRKMLVGEEPGAVDAWKRFDWRTAWNFDEPMPPEFKKTVGTPDTIGAVARDGSGRFAAAVSTGGTTLTLRGRVGDVPIYGAGLFAGSAGAVACTGNGEDIVRHLVARSVYQSLEHGVAPQEAVEKALAAFPADIDLGIIAISSAGEGGGCNYSAETDTFNRRYAGNMAWSIAR